MYRLVDREIPDMFGRRRKVGADDEGGRFIAKLLSHEFETERMKEAARSSQRSVAILKPQIPIGVGQSIGWFGGNAALPLGMAWPEQDGQKLLFVGQINLSALPQDLWSGVGPRVGWLGIFLPAHWPPNPTIIHFDGPLAEAIAPAPNSADWTRIYNFEEPRSFALPKWPLIAEVRPGNDLHGHDVSGLNKEPQQRTLLDPAYHPFNRETVLLLCTALSDAVAQLARRIVSFPAMNNLRPADAALFERKQSVVLDTFVRFYKIEARMLSLKTIDAAEIAGFINELAELDAYDLQNLRTDDDGYSDLVLRDTKLLDWQPSNSELRHWWNRYHVDLTNHAIKAYTSDSTVLPALLRERFEADWQSQTQDGLAAMGHAPVGHIYTPHGPDSSNEVLLEIHTSKIAGLIWADCYSLVLIIDRNALHRGDFSKVTFDITN
ncbi:DUF1963 domain-containing protein [Methylorubrum sp. POS3]|uniref:DUF1963 domain-containing protein n=1 Tax=Methylorubrum sp. POS3 TaxID=2998492 RepID=UPI00372941F3